MAEKAKRPMRDASGKELTQEEIEAMEIRRIKLPHDNQVLGVCVQRVGGSRMKVKCMDGKERICRIPGRLRRKLWVREGDILLVEPWELSSKDKGDVLYKYRGVQVDFLKRKGLLEDLELSDEF